ncbi:MAG: O-methyltransferase [candidate division Zixibacteria bacterium]|nr:O-methyltransferase [candidate division Zixibacteria bacterium]
MIITEPKFDEYIARISREAQLPDSNLVLRDMEDYADRENFPIIGPLVGRFLRQLALVTGAENIFEMGSGYGYSAIWFAGGMKSSGRIVCTEGSIENKTRALDYLAEAGYDSMIDFQVGDAREIIKKYDGPFDIILNDIDKEQYPEAFDLAVPRLRRGGLFITDNVLWSGRIFDKNPDEATRGILEFNHKLFEAKELFTSIMPIRDGLGIAVKI